MTIIHNDESQGRRIYEKLEENGSPLMVNFASVDGVFPENYISWSEKFIDNMRKINFALTLNFTVLDSPGIDPSFIMQVVSPMYGVASRSFFATLYKTIEDESLIIIMTTVGNEML